MTISAAILALAPILYWKLDDATGPAASDSSGHGNAGVYGGSSFELGLNGPEVGTQALMLQGAGTCQSLGDTPVKVRPISASYWFAPITLSAADAFGMYNGNGGSTGVGTVNHGGGLGGNTLLQILRGGIAFGPSFAFSMLDQNWHNCGFSLDAAGNFVGCVDGTQTVTAAGITMNAVPAGQKCQVGVGASNAGFFAHLAIWNSALSAAQLNGIYTSAGPRQAPSTVSTVTSADLSAIQATLNSILAAVRKSYVAP